jgi:hypothetical protein
LGWGGIPHEIAGQKTNELLRGRGSETERDQSLGEGKAERESKRVTHAQQIPSRESNRETERKGVEKEKEIHKGKNQTEKQREKM